MEAWKQMEQEAEQQLAEAIEGLYRTFARYPLRPSMDGCPHCVHEADQARLRSRPLRLLSIDDLSKYAFKALSTWGDEEDFRHFLPRLFQIASRETIALVDPEILFGKLPYADWRTWPLAEQQALEQYFVALWEYVLVTREPDPWTHTDTYLCAIAQAIAPLHPYLMRWKTHPHPLAHAHLVAFIEQCGETLGTADKYSFWGTHPAAITEVLAWLATLDETKRQPV